MTQLRDEVIRLDLAPTIEHARRVLFETAPTPIEYLDPTDTRSSSLPAVLANRRLNVYALWTRVPSEDTWVLRYVGQRTITRGTRRLCEHLFDVHERTQSKLSEVRIALAQGLEIGVTGLAVEPDSLRLTLEDELISIAKQGGTLWNRKGGRTLRPSAP